MMKNTRKLLSILLTLIMLFSFTGCDLESYEYESDSSVITSTNEATNTLSNGDGAKIEESSQAEDNTSTQSQKPSSVGSGTVTVVNPTSLPKYSGEAFIVVNNNQPNFSASELTTKGYEKYSNLDSLGRCGAALASCGKEIMPGENEKRGSISNVKPTGWVQKNYSGISGGYLWNRCHLIGWQLSAENANEKNLITGTRYMNINGMLPFENMVADYIEETGNHVAYRITPIFEGRNLVCSGVQMEAYSIEDSGDGICFNVYCYNVQPGIVIDYATGNSSNSNGTSTVTPIEKEKEEEKQTSNSTMVWIPKSGSKYHSNSGCSNMKNPSKVTKDEAIQRGYDPCKKCY